MRNIKFRAKLKVKLGELPKGSWVYFTIQELSFNDVIDWSTLCQYIGTSKYNIDIYEGDVAKTKLGQIAIVQYFDVAHTFGYKVVNKLGKSIWVEVFDFDCHIIDNIFDNPEYLKIEENK